MLILAKKKPSKQPPKRQQPDVPTQGDIGPDTPAQREGAQIIELHIGGGKVLRKRRNHLLDAMHRRGSLSRRQVAAGMEFLKKWEGRDQSPAPAWTKAYVQSSPMPGDFNEAKLDAQSEFDWLESHVDAAWRWLVYVVVIEEMPIKRKPNRRGITTNDDLARQYRVALRRQLNKLANALRI